MKVDRRDPHEERLVLTGMIVDRVVCGRVASKWEKNGLFASQWSNLVAGWCVNYFLRYTEPPKAAIMGLFHDWAAAVDDAETVALVENFLSGLSRDYETIQREMNSGHVLDVAGQYFRRVALGRLRDGIEADLANGRIDAAQGRVSAYGSVEMGVGAGIDVFQDQDAIQGAFASRAEPLVTFGGDLGKFWGDSLERDGFITFLGPEKRGKSFFLMDMAFRAALQRRKVAYFEVGDMSQNQLLRRLMARVARRPMRAGTYQIPTGIMREQEERLAQVVTEEVVWAEALDPTYAWGQVQECVRRQIRSDDSYLKLSVHPNSTLTVDGMRSILQTWAHSGWVADVIVIDYADILAPPAGTADTRDQINGTWKQLRRLSQQFHCLVVTASQTDAGSYGTEIIGMGNFSEDKRKNAHVTGAVGLNQNVTERQAGIIRLNWVLRREDSYNSQQCVHVAGCLAVGNPCMVSTF